MTRLAALNVSLARAWRSLFPPDWYPQARAMQREITLHVGPTNSGKTFSALQALKQAKGAGIYLGPLRLLARQTRDQLLEEDIACNLVTGQERELVNHAAVTASTVEMLDKDKDYDVCVLDEMQLMGCPQRGWAWTRALLAIQAKEIHICGEEGIVDIVSHIANSVGDQVRVRRYERLNKLVVSTEELALNIKDMSKLRRGDCVVAFSRRQLFNMKRIIEGSSTHKCCLIYGSLPPLLRRDQAQVFNDPSNAYTVLLATDAIGLGLNLSIQRVIFSTLRKFDGVEERGLTAAEIKQIGGRAGRFGVVKGAGEVVGRSVEDTGIIKAALSSPPKPVEQAFVQVPDEVVVHRVRSQLRRYVADECSTRRKLVEFKDQRSRDSIVFGRKVNEAYQAVLMDIYGGFTTEDPVYEVGDIDDALAIIKLVSHVPLTLTALQTLAKAPVKLTDDLSTEAVRFYAEMLATDYASLLADLDLLPHDMELDHRYRRPLHLPYINMARARTPGTPNDIQAVESVYHVLELSLWLSWRFEHTEDEREELLEQRETCARLIGKGILNVSVTSLKPRKHSKRPHQGRGKGRMKHETRRRGSKRHR